LNFDREQAVQAMQWISYWGLSAFLGAVLGGLLAGPKNRDFSYWMAWCFVFPPLVILLLLLPKKQGPRPRQPSLDEIDRRTGS
jgi:MFS family permease